MRPQTPPYVDNHADIVEAGALEQSKINLKIFSTIIIMYLIDLLPIAINILNYKNDLSQITYLFN